MLASKMNLKLVTPIKRIMFSLFLLPLIISTNVDVYGALESLNESLAYKYGSTTDRSKMEIEQLFKECTVLLADLTVDIYFEDKCKPVIDHYKGLGWYVVTISKSLAEKEKDQIGLALGFTGLFGCQSERFEGHVLLQDREDCQKVIKYYLEDGYDLVDKYDKKVELVQMQGNQTTAAGSK